MGNLLFNPDHTSDSLCKELAAICKKDSAFQLSIGEQAHFCQQLRDLKILSHQDQIINLVPPVINHYLFTIAAQGETCHDREMLLGHISDVIQKEVCLDLDYISDALLYMPELTNSKHISSLLKGLHEQLIKNRQNVEAMAPDKISFSLHGIHKLDTLTYPLTQEIIKELAWHIEQNAKVEQWFYTEELTRAFTALCSYKQESSPKADKLLNALLSHLEKLTEDKEWLADWEIASIIESLAHVHFDDKSQAILSELIQHIEHHSEQENWIDATHIGTILNHLSGMQIKDATVSTLLTLAPHITHIDSEYPLTLVGINTILSILPNLSNPAIELEILAALTTQLSLQIIDEIEDKTIKFMNYLNKAMLHLNQYLAHSAPAAAQSAARAFLQKAIDVFKPPFTVELGDFLDKSSVQEKAFHSKKLTDDSDSDEHTTHSTHSSQHEGETSSNSSSSPREY